MLNENGYLKSVGKQVGPQLYQNNSFVIMRVNKATIQNLKKIIEEKCHT